MTKNNKWTVTIITVPLLLLASVSVFASKPRKAQTPEAELAVMTTETQSASRNNQNPSDDVVVTFTLEDGTTQKMAAVQPVSTSPSPDSLGVSAALESAREKMRSLAVQLIGTPYKWGGTTPKAFDCSGFTRYIYSMMGVKIPRTAREQYKAGNKVKAGNWKIGDLVFFDMSKGYVSHVGMYLGGLSFIHASTPRTGVRIDSLKTRTYKSHYVGARRFDIS